MPALPNASSSVPPVLTDDFSAAASSSSPTVGSDLPERAWSAGGDFARRDTTVPESWGWGATPGRHPSGDAFWLVDARVDPSRAVLKETADLIPGQAYELRCFVRAGQDTRLQLRVNGDVASQATAVPATGGWQEVVLRFVATESDASTLSLHSLGSSDGEQAYNQLAFDDLSVSKISTVDFSPQELAVLEPPQVVRWTGYMLCDLSQEQLQAIPPACIAALGVAAISRLSVQAVGRLSPAQVAALRPEQLNAMLNVQLRGLTAAQCGALTPAQRATLLQRPSLPITPGLAGVIGTGAVLVTQSSTFAPGFGADAAIDNQGETFNHTNNGSSEWLQLDLGATQRVTRVLLTNRAVLGSRLNGAHVQVLDASGSILQDFGAITAATDGWRFEYGVDIPGARYVRITQSNQYLHLAEFQVEVAPAGLTIASLSAAQVAALDPVQVAALRPEQLASMSGEQLRALTAAQCDQLTTAQRAALRALPQLPLTPALGVALGLGLVVATQSSTYGAQYAAGAAIDNEGQTFSHTDNGANEWLQLDLGGTQCLTKVRLTNRADCGDRLNGAHVQVLDASGAVLRDLGAIAGATNGSRIEYSVNVPGARYVRVCQSNQYLSLAEFQVDVASPPAATPDPAGKPSREHPWLTLAAGEDAFVRGVDDGVTLSLTGKDLRAGDQVQLVDQDGQPVGVALNVTAAQVAAGACQWRVPVAKLGAAARTLRLSARLVGVDGSMSALSDPLALRIGRPAVDTPTLTLARGQDPLFTKSDAAKWFKVSAADLVQGERLQLKDENGRVAAEYTVTAQDAAAHEAYVAVRRPMDAAGTVQLRAYRAEGAGASFTTASSANLGPRLAFGPEVGELAGVGARFGMVLIAALSNVPVDQVDEPTFDALSQSDLDALTHATQREMAAWMEIDPTHVADIESLDRAVALMFQGVAERSANSLGSALEELMWLSTKGKQALDVGVLSHTGPWFGIVDPTHRLTATPPTRSGNGMLPAAGIAFIQMLNEVAAELASAPGQTFETGQALGRVEVVLNALLCNATGTPFWVDAELLKQLAASSEPDEQGRLSAYLEAHEGLRRLAELGVIGDVNFAMPDDGGSHPGWVRDPSNYLISSGDRLKEVLAGYIASADAHGVVRPTDAVLNERLIQPWQDIGDALNMAPRDAVFNGLIQALRQKVDQRLAAARATLTDRTRLSELSSGSPTSDDLAELLRQRAALQDQLAIRPTELGYFDRLMERYADAARQTQRSALDFLISSAPVDSKLDKSQWDEHVPMEILNDYLGDGAAQVLDRESGTLTLMRLEGGEVTRFHVGGIPNDGRDDLRASRLAQQNEDIRQLESVALNLLYRDASTAERWLPPDIRLDALRNRVTVGASTIATRDTAAGAWWQYTDNLFELRGIMAAVSLPVPNDFKNWIPSSLAKEPTPVPGGPLQQVRLVVELQSDRLVAETGERFSQVDPDHTVVVRMNARGEVQVVSGASLLEHLGPSADVHAFLVGHGAVDTISKTATAGGRTAGQLASQLQKGLQALIPTRQHDISVMDFVVCNLESDFLPTSFLRTFLGDASARGIGRPGMVAKARTQIATADFDLPGQIFFSTQKAVGSTMVGEAGSLVEASLDAVTGQYAERRVSPQIMVGSMDPSSQTGRRRLGARRLELFAGVQAYESVLALHQPDSTTRMPGYESTADGHVRLGYLDNQTQALRTVEITDAAEIAAIKRGAAVMDEVLREARAKGVLAGGAADDAPDADMLGPAMLAWSLLGITKNGTGEMSRLQQASLYLGLAQGGLQIVHDLATQALGVRQAMSSTAPEVLQGMSRAASWMSKGMQGVGALVQVVTVGLDGKLLDDAIKSGDRDAITVAGVQLGMDTAGLALMGVSFVAGVLGAGAAASALGALATPLAGLAIGISGLAQAVAEEKQRLKQNLQPLQQIDKAYDTPLSLVQAGDGQVLCADAWASLSGIDFVSGTVAFASSTMGETSVYRSGQTWISGNLHTTDVNDGNGDQRSVANTGRDLDLWTLMRKSGRATTPQLALSAALLDPSHPLLLMSMPAVAIDAQAFSGSRAGGDFAVLGDALLERMQRNSSGDFVGDYVTSSSMAKSADVWRYAFQRTTLDVRLDANNRVLIVPGHSGSDDASFTFRNGSNGWDASIKPLDQSLMTYHLVGGGGNYVLSMPGDGTVRNPITVSASAQPGESWNLLMDGGLAHGGKPFAFLPNGVRLNGQQVVFDAGTPARVTLVDSQVPGVGVQLDLRSQRGSLALDLGAYGAGVQPGQVLAQALAKLAPAQADAASVYSRLGLADAGAVLLTATQGGQLLSGYLDRSSGLAVLRNDHEVRVYQPAHGTAAAGWQEFHVPGGQVSLNAQGLPVVSYAAAGRYLLPVSFTWSAASGRFERDPVTLTDEGRLAVERWRRDNRGWTMADLLSFVTKTLGGDLNLAGPSGLGADSLGTLNYVAFEGRVLPTDGATALKLWGRVDRVLQAGGAQSSWVSMASDPALERDLQALLGIAPSMQGQRSSADLEEIERVLVMRISEDTQGQANEALLTAPDAPMTVARRTELVALAQELTALVARKPSGTRWLRLGDTTAASLAFARRLRAVGVDIRIDAYSDNLRETDAIGNGGVYDITADTATVFLGDLQLLLAAGGGVIDSPVGTTPSRFNRIAHGTLWQQLGAASQTAPWVSQELVRQLEQVGLTVRRMPIGDSSNSPGDVVESAGRYGVTTATLRLWASEFGNMGQAMDAWWAATNADPTAAIQSVVTRTKPLAQQALQRRLDALVQQARAKGLAAAALDPDALINAKLYAQMPGLLTNAYITVKDGGLDSSGYLRWRAARTGTPGDTYIYDNPVTHLTEFFELTSVPYGNFPTDATSNGSWRYLGNTATLSTAQLNDLRVFAKVVQLTPGDVVSFDLKAATSHYYLMLQPDADLAHRPPEGASNAYWAYVGDSTQLDGQMRLKSPPTAQSQVFDMAAYGQWGPGDPSAKVGDVYAYQNPFSGKTELFQLRHVSDQPRSDRQGARYDWFPTNGTSNGDWLYMGDTETLTAAQLGGMATSPCALKPQAFSLGLLQLWAQHASAARQNEIYRQFQIFAGGFDATMLSGNRYLFEDGVLSVRLETGNSTPFRLDMDSEFQDLSRQLLDGDMSKIRVLQLQTNGRRVQLDGLEALKLEEIVLLAEFDDAKRRVDIGAQLSTTVDWFAQGDDLVGRDQESGRLLRIENAWRSQADGTRQVDTALSLTSMNRATVLNPASVSTRDDTPVLTLHDTHLRVARQGADLLIAGSDHWDRQRVLNFFVGDDVLLSSGQPAGAMDEPTRQALLAEANAAPAAGDLTELKVRYVSGDTWREKLLDWRALHDLVQAMAAGADLSVDAQGHFVAGATAVPVVSVASRVASPGASSGASVSATAQSSAAQLAQAMAQISGPASGQSSSGATISTAAASSVPALSTPVSSELAGEPLPRWMTP